MSEEDYNSSIGFPASFLPIEYEGPKIVQAEKPPSKIYECEGDSVIRILNSANLEFEAEQRGFADHDTGTFMNWFLIRKLVFYNSGKETIAIVHLFGEYEDKSGNWQACKNVMIGPPAGPSERISLKHDTSINLPALHIASHAVMMDVAVHSRPGHDEVHRDRAHKSLPQPLKLRLTVHDTMGKVCRLIFEQFNPPLILPTQERIARRLSIDTNQIVDWVSVDDCERLERTFTLLYMDDKLCLHVVTSSSEASYGDRFLDEDNIKSLQKKAKKNKTTDLALDRFGVSDKVQHTALFDPTNFRMYALRIVLESTTSKTSKTIRLPVGKIKKCHANQLGSRVSE